MNKLYVSNGDLLSPSCVYIDNLDNIYACDYWLGYVTKYDKNGNYLLTFVDGSYGQEAVAVNPLNSYVYTIDQSISVVNVYGPSGNLLRQLGTIAYPPVISYLDALAVTNDGVLYVTSSNNFIIYIYNITSQPEQYIGNITNIYANTITYNSINNTLYIEAFGDTATLYILSRNGTILNTQSIGGPIQFDKYGNTYIAVLSTLYVYNSEGELIGNLTNLPSTNFAIFSNKSIIVLTNNGLVTSNVPLITNSQSLKSQSLKSQSLKSQSLNSQRFDNNNATVITPFIDTTGFTVVISLSSIIGIAIISGCILIYFKKRFYTKPKSRYTVSEMASTEFIVPTPKSSSVISSITSYKSNK